MTFLIIKLNYNCVLIIICKFLKQVIIFFKKNIYIMEKWVKILLNELIDWEILKIIINN